MSTLRTYTHLSPEERALIMLHYQASKSIRTISHFLGRTPSTISRKLKRFAGEPVQYDATTAANGYRERRAQPVANLQAECCFIGAQGPGCLRGSRVEIPDRRFASSGMTG